MPEIDNSMLRLRQRVSYKSVPISPSSHPTHSSISHPIHFWLYRLNLPNKLGRLGDIGSGGDDETACFPFDEDEGEGVDRLELLIGLDHELEVDEL